MTLPSNWKDQLEEAVGLRGWTINSFAQLEYLLGDLILRCRSFPDYQKHTRTLPHGAVDRIARVKVILKMPGPLQQGADRVSAIIDQMVSHQDTRNLLVHGFATLLHTPQSELGFHFQKFHRQTGRDDARLIRTFTLASLRSERDRQVAFAAEAVEQFELLYGRLGWEGPLANKFRGNETFD